MPSAYGQPMPGAHTPIITESLWLNAREVARQVALERRPVDKRSVPNLLMGLIYGPAGNLFCLNSHHNRYGQIYRYYVPSGRKRYGANTDPRHRYRADEFDTAVLAAIEPYVPRTVDRAKVKGPDILRKLVNRVDVGLDDMVISLNTGATIEAAVTCRVRPFVWRNGPRAAAAGRPGESSSSAVEAAATP